jgi:hypothetical protein
VLVLCNAFVREQVSGIALWTLRLTPVGPLAGWRSRRSFSASVPLVPLSGRLSVCSGRAARSQWAGGISRLPAWALLLLATSKCTVFRVLVHFAAVWSGWLRVHQPQELEAPPWTMYNSHATRVQAASASDRPGNETATSLSMPSLPPLGTSGSVAARTIPV